MAAVPSITMTITGIDETIANLTLIPKSVTRSVKKEMRIIGKEMLVDLKSITPVVTGRLKKSAYFEMWNDNDQLIQGGMGYKMPYAPEIELKHGMLANTLRSWDNEIRGRLETAMVFAINKVSYAKKSEMEGSKEADEPESDADPEV